MSYEFGMQHGASEDNRELAGQSGVYIPPAEGKQYSPYYYGGYYDTVQYDQNGNPQYTHQSGASDAAARYQDMAAKGDQRTAYAGDYSDYNAAVANAGADRDRAISAYELTRAAATGQAPSQAENLARNMLDQSQQAGTSLAASARGGPLQQAVALRNAQNASAVQRQQGMNSIAAMRAAEMATARGQLGGQANSLQAVDATQAQIGLARTGQDIQNQQFNQQLNQQNEQYYEGMANDVQKTQLNANLGYKSENDQAWQAGRGLTMQDEQNTWNRAMQVGSIATGGGMGIAQGIMKSGSEPVYGQDPTLPVRRNPY